MTATITKFLLGAAALLFGISQGAAAQDKLVFMNWGGTWADYAKKAFIDQFEKDTGIKVEVRVHQNTLDGLAKLQATRNNLDVDVWATSPVPAIVAQKDRLLVAFDASQVPNAAKISKNLITPACIAWYKFFFGIVYNENKVPFKPTEWEDLFDPRLKGQVAVPSASNDEGKFLIMLSWLGGGDEDNDGPGFANAKRLVHNAVTFYKSYTERDKSLAAGEATVGAFSPYREYLDLAENNPQFKFAVPEPWVIADFDCISVVKGKNQPLAYKFVNYMLSKSAQESFANDAIVVPAVSDVATPASLASFAPPESKYRYPNSAIVETKLQGWVDRWNQEIESR
jgi:putative spermidine/putrescine transport system substrate-binding protein